MGTVPGLGYCNLNCLGFLRSSNLVGLQYFIFYSLNDIIFVLCFWGYVSVFVGVLCCHGLWVTVTFLITLHYSVAVPLVCPCAS